MTFLTTPYYGGKSRSLRNLATLLLEAKTANKRIAVIGDSQEDTTGDGFCDDLNAVTWVALGKCNETVLASVSSYGSTASHPAYWLTNTARVNNAATTVPTSYMPPGRGVIGQTPYAFLNLRTMLNFKADNSVWLPAGDYTILDPSGGLTAECFFYTNSAGSDECLWQHTKGAAPPGTFFQTVVASGSFSGLSASDNVPLKFTISLPTYDASNPYSDVKLGHNVNSGIQMAGIRISAAATAGGITWNSFSVGGYDTTDLTGSHADCGPMFKLMGGTNGWDAVAIGLANNNAYVLEQDKAAYKTALSGAITTLRTWNDNTDTLIILLSDPPVTGSGWPAGALDKFNVYEDAQYELANELENVVSINSKRLMYDAGYDPSNATYSADGLHPTDLGAKLRANVVGKQLFGLEAALLQEVSINTASLSQIVAAINADSTQQTLQTNASTAATQATTAAAEVVKVPRAAASVTAGGNVTRTKVTDTSTALTETLS